MSEGNIPMDKDDTPLPYWFILTVIPILISIIFGLLLFGPSGWDWAWLEAWLFIGTFSINFTISYVIINAKNPRLIRNRSKIKKEIFKKSNSGIKKETKKAAASDWIIMPLVFIGYVGATVFPAIEKRFGFPWVPQLHIIGEIIALVVMNFGLIVMNTAQLQNSYASKVLDINKGQQLVDTGLYARVRHPLYLGAIILIIGLPLALGSIISIIFSLIMCVALIIRIKPEEEMLLKEMKGYEKYCELVKYKLIPGIF
jgi:protein-S-isoprenylcysteine O-methyltransferase Ste14